MKRALLSLLAPFGLFAGADVARACRIPQPPIIPISVARTPYDAVALAEVVSRDSNGADVRYTEAFDGRLDRDRGRISWGIDPNAPPNWVVITCGPGAGPQLQPGDRVVVLLTRTSIGLYPLGWMKLDDANHQDEFFGIYLAERRPAARLRLSRRWHLVNLHAGPVPVGDPAGWLAPEQGQLGRGPWVEGVTNAEFEVDPHGRVTNCIAGQPGRGMVAGNPLCTRLGARRFLAPIFARERRGFYQVREASAAPQ